MQSRTAALASIFAVSLLVLLVLPPVPALADSWTQVASGGMDGEYVLVQTEMKCSVEWNGNLYVGTDHWLDYGLYIWRYDGSDWERVSTLSFGNHTSISYVYSMAVFGSYLYVGTGGTGGCRVFRTQGVGGPPSPTGSR